jgi:ABC-type polysaccharide/polyol phosphate export permease
MLRQRKDLVLALARRDILDRYAGKALGGLWAAVLLSVGIFAVGFRVYTILQPNFGNAL